MDEDLSDFPIQYIKGVGPQRARLFNRIGISSVKDALSYLPYRYEDRSRIKKISDLKYGALETVAGKIVSAEVIKLPGRNLRIFELVVNDGSGLLKGKWFNQPFMKKNFRAGQEVLLSGVVKRNPYWGIGFEIDNPEFEIIHDEDDAHIHTNRIDPVYRVTSGLSVRQMRSIMFTLVQSCIHDVNDLLPEICQRPPTALQPGEPGLSGPRRAGARSMRAL